MYLSLVASSAALACAPAGQADTPGPVETAPRPAQATAAVETAPRPAQATAPVDAGPGEPAVKRRHAQVARGKAVTLEQAPEATRAAFWTAVKAGRKQTAAKQFAAAITSFDAALQALPDHPRALSGRGYARLLAGDLAAAEADLRRALAAPGTRKLESAIAFNLGLVAEQRGDLTLARAQFSLANTLHPGKAAAAKLAGAVACPVVIEYGAPDSQLYATWIELWRHLDDDGVVDSETAPANEAAAQKIACTSEALRESETAAFDACSTAGGPWLVKHYTDFGGHALYVIEPADAGQLRMTDLGMAGGGRCGCLSDASITGSNPAIVTWQLQEFAPIDVMEDASGQIVECDGGDCFSACGEEIDGGFSAHVFSSRTADPTLLRGPLVDRDRGTHPAADIKVVNNEIVVTGGGCDLRTPLVDPRG